MSMKNKFVTAVTTAGLLAGILGSAFTPSAKAAAGQMEWTVGTSGSKCLVPNGYAASTEEGTSALPMILGSSSAENLLIDVSECKDEFGTAVTGTVSLSATGAVKFNDSVAAYNTAKTAGSVSLSADRTLTVIETSTTAYGSGSITVSLGGVSKTIYYLVVGPLATIELTNGDEFGYLAAATAGTTDKLTYVEKDAAGTTLTATATGSVTYSKDGGTAGALGADGDTTAGVYVNEGSDAGKLTIAAGSCADADAGKQRTVAIKIGTVTSNTIQFTCTLGGNKAVLTSAELDDTTLYAGGTAKVIYTFTDGTRPLGFGAVIGTLAVSAADFPNTFASDASSTKSTMGTWAATGLVVDKRAQATSVSAVVTANAKVALGNRKVVLTIADADLKTTGNQAKSISLKYSIIDESADDNFDATISKVKYSVTADFGTMGAKKKISFVVENTATGAVVTYVRKANASGVASYTVGRKGTFEIYAMFGEELTDSVVVKR